jgi:antitoxin component YwqK of YwqJK toxin-antitoxin module
MKASTRRFVLLFVAASFVTFVIGQKPKYTYKKFLSEFDSSTLKNVSNANGLMRKYMIVENIEVYDLDDDHTTFIKGNITAVLCFEGHQKNGRKEGIENVFLIDSLHHSKRYKIWEQTYSNDKLNGNWTTFTLSGTVYSFHNYKNDSLDGISRYFSIDGKTIVSETDYFNGQNKFIKKTFYQSGKIKFEVPYEDDKINGTGKEYYENGKIKDITEFKDGEFNGVRKYYYSSGQLWIEQIYKGGKNWTVIANYTDKGVKRTPGTLMNGNGTIIYYNEDGTVREVITYVNGVKKQ